MVTLSVMQWGATGFFGTVLILWVIIEILWFAGKTSLGEKYPWLKKVKGILLPLYNLLIKLAPILGIPIPSLPTPPSDSPDVAVASASVEK